MSSGESENRIRLQKYLADQGIASRRTAEKLIAEGAVQVNGKLITEMGVKIDPNKDSVEVSGDLLKQKKDELIYIMLHKPKGYVTTTHRTKVENKIVMDLLPKDLPRVFPVGRLDKDSTGLLLLTNDGDLAYRLTHPKFEHEKEYLVEAMNDLSGEQVEKLKKGLPLFGKKTKPPKIKMLSTRKFLITLTEGKNRQIRRLLRKIGTGVKSLKRVRIEDVRLDSKMQSGEWKFLSLEEVKQHLLSL